MTTNTPNTPIGDASRADHPGQSARWGDQSGVDNAQESVWAEIAARTETERAHAAGLITFLSPDPEAFYGTGDAVAYRVSPVPNVSVSAQHAVKRGRNKRGETRKVVARGVPYVTGDTRVYGVPGDETGAVVPFVLACLLDPEHPATGLRRRRVGVNALDVTRVTDAVFGPFGLEPLIGTDAESWSEVVPCDRSDAYRFAYAAGHVYRPMLLATVTDENTAHDGTLRLIEHGAHPSGETTARHRARTSLPRVKPRKGERVHAAPYTRPSATRVRSYTWQGAPFAWRHLARGPMPCHDRVTPLLAPADQEGAVFYGHRLVTRSATTRTRVKRAARTIGHVTNGPTSELGWSALADGLANGERVTVDHDGATVTLTRSRSGRWNGRVKFPTGDTVVVGTARTSTAIGRRVHLIIG